GEEQECRGEKQGSLHVWKSELTEVEDDTSPRHSSSPACEYG
uniref:Histocompatibility minor HB-1 n=1 Tax=Propithecus coquereli TaxID=379532 RepID=A0A2K6FJB0_PROCO